MASDVSGWFLLWILRTLGSKLNPKPLNPTSSTAGICETSKDKNPASWMDAELGRSVQGYTERAGLSGFKQTVETLLILSL